MKLETRLVLHLYHNMLTPLLMSQLFFWHDKTRKFYTALL